MSLFHVALASAAIAVAARSAAAAAPPNVLLISSDSMDGRVLDSRQHIGRSVQLPALRALAARGVNFVNAYSHSPVCGPSRAAMLTSRYVHDIGAWNNYQEIVSVRGAGVDPACVRLYGAAQCEAWAAAFPVPLTLFDAFADAGYEMAVFGKIDAGADLGARYNDSSSTDDHTGPEVRTVPRGAGLVRNSMAWSGWSATTDDANAFADDNATAERAVGWLQARAARASRAAAAGAPPPPPFFAYVGLSVPHPPFTTNARWLAQVNASTIHPPWAPEEQAAYHPFDWHMSVSKGCTEPTTHADIMRIREVRASGCVCAMSRT